MSAPTILKRQRPAAVPLDLARLGRAGFTGLAAVLAALTWLPLLQQARSAMPPTQTWEGIHMDFFSFYVSAERLRRGLALYPLTLADGRPLMPNTNHPLVAVLMGPLARLPADRAYAIWSALGVAAFVLAAGLTLREVRMPWRAWYTPGVIASLVAFPGLTQALQLGQVSLILALPVVGVWLLLRRGRIVLAGLLLGVLVALKLFLFPLFALFLCRRAWRGLLAGAAGSATATLAALPFAGAVAFRDWFATLRLVDWYGHNGNVSLAGVLWRTIAPPPPSSLVWLLAALVAAIAWWAISRPGWTGPVGTDRRFALLLAAAILGSPLGWQHYLVVLLPAFAALGAAWPELSARARCIVAAAGLALWPPPAIDLLIGMTVPLTAWSALTIYAAQTYGLLILTVVLYRSRRPAHAPGGARA